MVRGFKSWAEAESLRMRAELRLHPLSPLSAKALAGHLGIYLIEPTQVPGMTEEILRPLHKSESGWSALTIQPDGSTIIITNPAHSPKRHESDVMHEIAHILCKHEPSYLLHSKRSYGPQEEEAQWLGACLQLPRDPVEK